MKKFFLGLLLTVSAVCNDALPVIHFNLQMFNSQETVEKVTGKHYDYVMYKNDIIPSQVTNSYASAVAECLPFYNSDETVEESKYSLSNTRIIEALLAQGYHLNAYAWILGKEEQPISGFACILSGYDREQKIFTGNLINGSATQFSYEYASKNLRLVEIFSENAPSRNWRCLVFSDEDFINSTEIKIETQAFANTSSSIRVQMEQQNLFSKKLECLAHILPKKSDRGEVEKSVKFSMQIKKKKLKSKGCGGFTWWPVGSKQWDTIVWDSAKNGRILYLDPTMPIDYPKHGSTNYFHNTHASCHPCSSSKMVPGVWVNVKVEGDMIRTKIVKKSTCNIGHGYLDKYGYSTATIVGLVNIWVYK